MRSCSFVKFEALIVMLEQCKCDELTRALCLLLPKFDVFDHFFKVRGAEIFWGAHPTPPSPPFEGASPSSPPCTANLGPQNTTLHYIRNT